MSRRVQLVLAIVALITSTIGLLLVFFEFKVEFEFLSILIGISGCTLGALIGFLMIKLLSKKPISKVFLAYSTGDKDFAGAFAEKLKENKIQVLNEDELVGMDFNNYIKRELKNVDYVLVLLSKDSNKSQYLNSVISISKSKAKRIIPILIDNTELPKNVSKYHYFNSTRNSIDTVTHELADKLSHAL